MPILSLTARLGLDGRGFRQGIKESERLAGQFGTTLKHQLAAAFSIGAITAFAKNLADTVGRIKDLSDQYGVTTDEVQKTDVALKKNGLQFEQLGQSIQKIGQARREAAEGNLELRETFRKFGVSLQDLDNPQRRNFDLILQITDAIKDQNLTAREQAELTDLLGARSFKLITTLQTLKDFEGIQLFTEHDIQLIDEANKKVEELGRRLKVLAAAGIVEGARDPAKFAADFFDIFPKGSGFNLIGKLFNRFAKEPVSAPPLTPEDVISANVGRKIQPAPETEGLFDVNKDLRKSARSISRFDSPAPGGFGAAGGFSSGFISGFKPEIIVARDQLAELQKANAKLDQVVRNTGAANSDGAFRR